MHSKIPFLVYLLLFIGCSDKPADTRAVRKEMESREPRKVTNAEITAAAQEFVSALWVLDSSSFDQKAEDLGLTLTTVTDSVIAAEGLAELMEAFQFQWQAGGDLDDHFLLTDDMIEIYHPVEKDSALSLLRLSIPTSVIIRSL